MRNLENIEYKYISSKNDIKAYRSLPTVLVYREPQLVHDVNGRLGFDLPTVKSPYVCGFSYGVTNKHELTIRFWKDPKALARVMVCEVLNGFGWQNIEYVKAILPYSSIFESIKEIVGDESDIILNDLIEGLHSYGRVKSECGFNLIAVSNSVEFKDIVSRIAYKLSKFDIPEDFAIDLDNDDVAKILEEYKEPIKYFTKEIILSESLKSHGGCIVGSNICKDMTRLFEASKIITSSSDRAKGTFYTQLYKSINSLKKVIDAEEVELSGLSTINAVMQFIDRTWDGLKNDVLYNELLKVAIHSDADTIKDLCAYAINNF